MNTKMVTFLKPSGVYNSNETASFSPAYADRLIAAGIARPAEAPTKLPSTHRQATPKVTK